MVLLLFKFIENVLIHEENDTRLWIGYPLNVSNILQDRDLQALVEHAEFDVSRANHLLGPSHNRRFARRFEVEAFGAQCQDDAGVGQVSDSHCVLEAGVVRLRFLYW